MLKAVETGLSENGETALICLALCVYADGKTEQALVHIGRPEWISKMREQYGQQMEQKMGKAKAIGAGDD
jgi:hypothetical protein